MISDKKMYVKKGGYVPAILGEIAVSSKKFQALDAIGEYEKYIFDIRLVPNNAHATSCLKKYFSYSCVAPSIGFYLFDTAISPRIAGYVRKAFRETKDLGFFSDAISAQ